MNALSPTIEADSLSPRIADALDYGRLIAIVEMADLAGSYWHSAALAAERGDRLTLETHCRQIAAVTKEAFATVKALGSDEAEL
jgi:sorbitol-specific phosphotransferase system component IIA